MLKNLNAVIQNLSPNLRKILSNTSWLIADRVLRMTVSFVVLAWMARYLGADQFGLLNYAGALVAIFSTLAQLGLYQIVVRDLVSEPSSKDEILGTAFCLRLTSGISAFLLGTGIIFLLRPDDSLSRTVVIIIAAGLLLQEFEVIDFWFESQVQSKYSVLTKNTAFIIMTVVKIVLIQLQAPLIAFAWAVLVENALTIISSVIAYQVSGQKIQAWRSQWQLAKKLMKVSWPLILSNLAIMVYVRIDQVMLGQLANDDAVGIYSAAVRISESWFFLTISLINSFKPSIIEAKRFSEKQYYERIQKVCSLLALLVYCVAIPMTFLSTPLIVLAFGKHYAPAGLVLSVHIWSSMFSCFGVIKDTWIAVEGLTSYALSISILGALMNILLNFWLIPIYGAMGAAVATVVSYGFTDYITCFLYPPARPMGWVMTKALSLSNLSNLIRR